MCDEAGRATEMRWERNGTVKRIPYFFAFGVPPDDAVYDGRFAGLCMEIVRADGVNLDVL